MDTVKFVVQFIVGAHIVLGAMNWLYLSWMYGSILMFLCFFLLPISIPVGIYSLYFGAPLWLIELFWNLPIDFIDVV